MVANAKRLAEFFNGESPRSPVGAMPVTVWVQRYHDEIKCSVDTARL